MPVLVQWGALDPLFSVKIGEEFHALIPQSELVVYKGVGHMPMEEVPEKSAQDFLYFTMK